MEIPELPTLATRLSDIIFFVAVIMLRGLERFLAVTDYLARHAAPLDPHLPIGLAYIITVTQSIILNTTIFVFFFIQTLVLVVAQICRPHYGDDASSIPGLPDAVHLPPPADPQEDTISPSPSPSYIPAEGTDLNPPLPDSPVALEVVDDGNTPLSPTSGHDRAVPEISTLLHYMATFLLERYFQERRGVDLTVSIDIFQVAEGLRLQPHPYRSITLNGLAVAIFMRYKRNRRGTDLSKATSLHREALSLRRPNEYVHPSSMKDLENETRTWLERHGSDFDLSNSISRRQEAQQPGYPNQVREYHSASTCTLIRLKSDLVHVPSAVENEANSPTDSFPSTGEHRPAPEDAGLLNNAALSLIKRYQQEGGQTDLTHAILLFRQALTLYQPGHPDRSGSLNNLAGAVLTRYQWYGGEYDLKEAIQLNREAVSLRPPGHPDRSMSLGNLANSVKTRYERDGGEHDLDEAIQLNREAVSLCPLGHPDRSAPLTNLANSVRTRYERDGGEHDLNEAIQLNREAVSLYLPGHPDRSISLNNLANAVQTRYEREGGEHDLEEAIQLHREAVALFPPGHPNRCVSLNNLANAVQMRYGRDGGEHDLEEVIQLNREGLSLRPPGHPGRSISLNNLANAVQTRYERDGGEQDLEEAIQLHREAVALFPPGHPNRSASLNNLAAAIQTRYDRDGGKHDLDEAIQLNKDAVSLRPPGHPDRSGTLNNLAGAVLKRYQWYGGEYDLKEAIQLNREAVSLRPPGHPGLSISLNNLANAVQTRYKRDGGEHDLEEVIQLNREGLSLRPPGHPDRSSSLNNLAAAVQTRYERYGGEQDLEEAIQLNREAVALCPPGHPNRSASLNNLAAAVQTRYERDGGEHDLEEAIQLHREAVSLRPPGHPDRSSSLNNLANAVQTRYERDGGEQDLEEAIQLHREALSLRPPGHPNRSASLNNLAAAVQTRYERDGGEQDLEEAIQLHREAVSLRPPGHPDRSSSLNNLAAAVQTRYERDGGEHDLEEAIQLHREVLSLRPPGHPDRSSSLNNLAGAVQTRYQRYGGEYDLKEAIQLNREAVSLFGSGHPERANSLKNLAAAVQIRYERDGGEHDLEQAIQLLQDATSTRTSPTPIRLVAALQWVDVAIKHNPNSAMDAYRSAFTLMGSVLALGRSLQDRRTNLFDRTRSRPTKSLALNAALWALSGNSPDPRLAIEFLDQGRNVLLASVGQLRADLSDVRRHNPALADDFYRISRVLDSTILTGQEISKGKSPHEDATSCYKRVSAEWEDVVAKIRLLPDCESFLLPVPYIKLQEAAVGGPVIVILVGKEWSTAIIVLPKGEPHTVDLPNASREALKELHQEMDNVLAIPSRAVRGMGRMLSDLWEILVQPIIQALQDVLRIPTGSRIWWYPTSWASFLPLHAAGSYRKGGLNVPSLYISSYTPTLQALRRSRGRCSSSLDQLTRPLIVSQAQTPGQLALPSVDDEVGIVFSLVPDASLLLDDQGTKERVLEELRGHSWIHLACHGHPDPSDPFKSHFALHKSQLSLQDIITNDLPSADFAFLSACHSAAQDRVLPDEGLALAGGMQFAGFRSVVGTLWEMADEDAPTLAAEFYKGLAAKSGDGERFDCTKAAESLHDAVQELKKQKVPLYRWINLVHYGI